MPSLCVSLLGSGLCGPVDLYCERTSPDVLAEPLNAVSNLAFVVAGWALLHEFRRSDVRGDDTVLPIIIVLVPIIGFGSLLFHTLGNRWAAWADVIPILAFMLFYLWFSFRRLLLWPRWLASLALAAFLVSTVALEIFTPDPILWGGAMYMPTLAACLVIACAPIDGPRGVRASISLAISLFVVGFTFRTLDMPLCEILPNGTHYCWHILNAIVLFLLVRAAILYERAKVASA